MSFLAGRVKCREVYDASPEGAFLIWPVHASWVLLYVGPRSGVAARCLRLPDWALLPLDSFPTRVLCPQAQRSAISLDVCLLWYLHSCLRRHTRNGSVDSVACGLLG